MATNSTEVNNDSVEYTTVNSDSAGTEVNASLLEQSRKRKHSLPCDGDDNHNNESLCPPLKKFEVIPSEKEFDYQLSDDQIDYVKKHFSTYISDSDLKNCILKENPVPTNVPKPATLDNYLKSILEERHKPYVVTEDKASSKIQQKLTDVMGPLSRVWSVIQKGLTSENGLIEQSMEELNGLIEQSILLLGQANNSITYGRRVRVLTALMKDTKGKQLLKEKASLLTAMDDNLFGPKFREDWCSSMKTKQKYTDLINKELKGHQKQQPFRGSPQNRGRGSRGRGFFMRRDSVSNSGTYTNNSNFAGKKSSSFFSSMFTRNSEGRFKICTSINKIPVYKSYSTSSIGREDSTLCIKLGKVNTGSENSRDSERIHNSFPFSSRAKSSTSVSSNESGGKITAQQRSIKYDTKGGYSQGDSSKKSLFEQHVCSVEKGRGQSSHNKSENFKQLHTLHTFQDGKSRPPERSFATKRLHVQNRPKGCIFLHSNKSTLKKVSEVHLGGESLRVSMPMFRSRASTIDFHKTFENSDSSFKKDNGENCCFPRRHVTNVKNSGISAHRKGDPHLSFAKFGICNKSEKVSTCTSSGNRISRTHYKFSKNDAVSTTGQSCADSEQMHSANLKSQNNNIGVNKAHREIIFHDSSGSPGEVTAPVFTISTDTGSPSGSTKLPISRSAKCKFPGRIKVVEREFIPSKWQASENNTIRLDDSDRCLNSGLGGSLSGNFHRRNMVDSGEELPHKCVRVVSSKISSTNFFEKPCPKNNSFTNRQHDSIELSPKNGGNEKSGYGENSQRNMEFPFFERDHDYCRISSKQAECSSGLGVSKHCRSERLAVGSSTVFTTNTNKTTTRDRSICLPSESSVKTVHVVAARPKQCGNRRTSTGVGGSVRLCVSSILSDNQNSQESGPRGVSSSFDNTNLAKSAMVFSSVGNVNSESSTSVYASTSFNKCSGTNTPASKTKTTEASGLDCFRQCLASEGLSEKATDLITNSRRRGSISNYQSAWRKWTGWCMQQQADPVRCDVNIIANYLAMLFHKGFEYSTINGHRSAISAYHNPINSVNVGEHPRICSLMTGVFNLRPTKPRFTFIWDVQVVIDHLNTLSNNEGLSIKILSHKLAMLLALTSASRGSEVCYLNMDHMVRSQDSYVFTLDKLTKTRKKGSSPPDIEFKNFSNNSKLCVVNTIDCYIRRTKEWRTGDKHTQLLLSTLRPHHAVVPSTVAGWIKSVLNDAGINTNLFSAHSTRSASTSKAKLMGLSTADILKRGSWSGKTTWQKHYRKTIQPMSQVFQNAIGLGGASN